MAKVRIQTPSRFLMMDFITLKYVETLAFPNSKSFNPGLRKQTIRIGRK